MKTVQLKMPSAIANMKIDTSLDKYDGKILFPDKYQKAVQFAQNWKTKNSK